MIRVLAPGALTTVQDLGRPGYGALGVPPAGAMDPWELRAANLLAGNPQDAAGLECTLSGPTLRFQADAVIALCGARFDATLDGEAALHGEAFYVREGQTLAIGRARDGTRCYLAVRGGIDVEPVLGSRSTDVASGIGPPPLRGGDVLRAGRGGDARLRRLRTGVRTGASMRAVPGPQEALFPSDARGAFWSGEFRVSPRSDRTGVRLEGIPIAGGADLLPEGTAHGTVQVPAGGEPIVLGPERPITGGYTKIATVITADMSLIAQARPGDVVRLRRVSIEEARAAWLERERALLEAIEEI